MQHTIVLLRLLHACRINTTPRTASSRAEIVDLCTWYVYAIKHVSVGLLGVSRTFNVLLTVVSFFLCIRWISERLEAQICCLLLLFRFFFVSVGLVGVSKLKCAACCCCLFCFVLICSCSCSSLFFFVLVLFFFFSWAGAGVAAAPASDSDCALLMPLTEVRNVTI